MSSADKQLYRAKATRNAVSVHSNRLIPAPRSDAPTPTPQLPATVQGGFPATPDSQAFPAAAVLRSAMAAITEQSA